MTDLIPCTRSRPEDARIQTNAVHYDDDSDNLTGCCPRFNTEGWDGQILHLEDKVSNGLQC